MTIAARIETCGQPPVVARRPSPAPGAGWETVRVLAAPITPLDLLCASGTSYFGTPALPYVPGVQGVGSVGGRLVWFPTPAGMAAGDGSMAEVALVRAEELVDLPADTDPFAMAALGLSAVAAYMALTWRGELAQGEQVLVLGGGGVVGQAAIQLARLAGARRVVAAARSERGLQRARWAGADAVVPLRPLTPDGAATTTDDPRPDARTTTDDPRPDARTGPEDGRLDARIVAEEIAEEVAELAHRLTAACDGPVDLVLDPLFGTPAAAAARTLRNGGRLVNLGGSASETCPLGSATLRSRSLRVLGYTNNELTREQRAAAITYVAQQSAAGRLRVAHEVVPLAEAAEAWQRQASGTARGRIVLHPG
ncbi:zinc-binding dehydrogenase [Nonomuraea gerenzanensis]|uniref:Alcohol dehydrogenase, zinc-binding n=1 Tax=Nonomuraea gerenzanensis TaxID=93944 RepID=A0A1M4EF41_9ACTN|nr:zinc-binding dehydrogenase [Nonomuraea gerenzanensis]UBU09037.1 zinc-binding dehydrogenase [Nonomuraea gerenzanensis]SBO97420.1 Alcohol dehydrogenase, zinc-binding [Nonomuraea gerenzanensis]